MIATNIVSEVGTSSTLGASILEPPVSDSEDPQQSSPPCDNDEADEEHATPSPKRPAVVDDASPSLTDVAQVIGSTRNLSASSRYSLLTNHFRPSVDYNFPKGPSGCLFQPQWLCERGSGGFFRVRYRDLWTQSL